MSATSMNKTSKSFAREHRERHQPAARAKRGLLEKKKDYLVRARNYHSKQERLKKLAEKAALKNPDEFYHHMEHARIKDGKYTEISEGERHSKYSHKQLQSMKAQDEGHIAYKYSIERKKLGALESDLHMLEDRPEERKHIIFVDDEEEAEKFDAAEYFETRPELLSRAFNRPTNKTLESGPISNATSEAEVSTLASQRARAYNELTQRSQRTHAMDEALSTLHVQRQLMNRSGGGARKKVVEPGARPIYRFKKERLR